MNTQKLGEVIQGLAKDSPDPMVQGLVQVLSQVLQQGGDEDDDRDRRRAQARNRMRQIRQTLELMTRRNALIASALGACHCWGSNAVCDDCGGRGSPGFREPARNTFEKLVVPLFEARPHLKRTLGDGERSARPTPQDPWREDDDGK